MVRLDSIVGVASGSVPTTAGQICLYPAGRGSRRGSFVNHLVRTRGAGDCRDSPWLSSGSTSRLPDHEFQKDRSLPFVPGCRQHGTGTANAGRCGQRSHPRARWRISISVGPAAADAPRIRTDGSSARWLCDPPPRLAISSSRSRRLRENRQYHRTQVTMMTGSNWRFRNSGGRQDLIASTYQMHRRNSSVPPPPQPVECGSNRKHPLSVYMAFRRPERETPTEGAMVRSTRETVRSGTTVPNF